MAALTANFENNQKAGEVVASNVGAGKKIWRGALIVTDDATGYIEPASDTAAKSFAGVAREPGDNTGGAAGDVGVRVEKNGSFVYDYSGTQSQAVVGKKVYAVDDHTVALATVTANDVYVGVVVGLVGTTQVRVRIDGAAL